VSRAVAPTGLATGIGSLPGDDIDAAMAMVFDELPDLPHLPELPARGPGADMIGRTAAQLFDLPVDLQPSGWRLVGRPGFDEQRARELMTRDLDALLPVAGPGYDGRLKLQLVGPWTLAAMLQLPKGGPVLGDLGATRDLIDSMTVTIGQHLHDVRERVPQAELVIQLDEPGLPGVLTGRVPTQSGVGRVRSVEESAARDALETMADAAGELPMIVHCCAADPPLRLLHDAGVATISLDLLAGNSDQDTMGELVEAGTRFWLGVLPTLGPGVPPTPRATAEPVRRLWRELGFAADLLPDRTAVTPSCGLAAASQGWARSAYRVLQQTARALAEAPEGTHI
jgi:hypothetical protein